MVGKHNTLTSSDIGKHLKTMLIVIRTEIQSTDAIWDTYLQVISSHITSCWNKQSVYKESVCPDVS